MRWWNDLWLNESFAEWASHWCNTNATRFTDAANRTYEVSEATLEAVLDANPDTIVVVNAASPVTMPWADRARRELAAIEGRKERLQAIERDRAALLEGYAGLMPKSLDDLDSEERHRIYNMLRLRVSAFPDGTLEVGGTLSDGHLVCKESTRRSLSRGT
jgi:aminopeptidase N